MAIFTVLILPMINMGVFPSDVFFSIFLLFLLHKSFIVLVMIIPRYFSLFGGGGYCEKNNLSDFFLTLSLVHMKATDFCVLILYVVTWMKVFISCRSFLVQVLGSFMNKTIVSVNRDTLNYFFPICISFFSFGCLNALAKTLGTKLNRYGKSGKSCLISHFSGNVLSFSLG